ncbi:unnamed protein product, partial [marine sediment metagenome]
MDNIMQLNRIKYVKSPVGWDPASANPFVSDGRYGPKWSSLEIIDDSDLRLHYRADSCSNKELYNCRVGRYYAELEAAIADFLRYESLHGRKVIVTCPEEIDLDTIIGRSLKNTPRASIIRDDDPKWVVHSTPVNHWEKIEACGQLRSIARLREEGVNFPAIGYEELGEPEEFKEYIAFGTLDAIGPENVVASHNKGFVFTEEHTPYHPGVRLYFDAHRIIKDGLAVRDGLHSLKVHDKLALNP